jgi:hypothetical protein
VATPPELTWTTPVVPVDEALVELEASPVVEVCPAFPPQPTSINENNPTLMIEPIIDFIL